MQKITASLKKSTDNKYVWTVNLDKVEFNLYIPKWRTPEPVPEKVLIKIHLPSEELIDKKFVSKNDIQLYPQLKKEKIYSDVHRISNHSQTVRFDPKGNSNDWEIGSPYIPKSLLNDQDLNELSLVIEWLGLNSLDESIELTGEKSNNKTSDANILISKFESKVRKFIEKQLKKIYNEEWWNQGVPEIIRKSAETRKSKKEKREPKRNYKIINFLNFVDYSNIILYNKNWNSVFSKFFINKYAIQAPFENLSQIRNDIAHNRFREEDFERCNTYIDDILKYLPDF